MNVPSSTEKTETQISYLELMSWSDDPGDAEEYLEIQLVHLQYEELLRKEKWLEGNWNWARTEGGDSFLPVCVLIQGEWDREGVCEWVEWTCEEKLLSFLVSFV